MLCFLVLFIVEFLEACPYELRISNIYICTSYDNGNSFTAKQIWKEKPYCISNDNIILLNNERILVPVVKNLGAYATADDSMGVFIIYSDDYGESFIINESGMLNLPMSGMMESYIVEYKSSEKTVLVCMTQLCSLFVAYSNDGGITFRSHERCF